MRVRQPDVQSTSKPYRWKRGAIVDVEIQEDADAIIAAGGTAVPDDEELVAGAAPVAAGGKRKGKPKG